MAVPMQDVTSSVTFLSFHRISDIPFLFDSYFFTFHTISPADLHPSPAPHFETYCRYFTKIVLIPNAGVKLGDKLFIGLFLWFLCPPDKCCKLSIDCLFLCPFWFVVD